MNLKKLPLFGTAVLLLGSEKAHCILKNWTGRIAAGLPSQEGVAVPGPAAAGSQVNEPTGEGQEKHSVQERPSGVMMQRIQKMVTTMDENMAGQSDELKQKFRKMLEEVLENIKERPSGMMTKRATKILAAIDENMAGQSEADKQLFMEIVTTMLEKMVAQYKPKIHPTGSSQEHGASHGHN
eukprot:GHVS01097305.1.p1 GENE.GHVS01097305.1~~GHVS01097305.1.p1  ORF type:complete len:182 (-),score=25.20 GHVS01097305.1:301-846(-)